MPPTARGDHGFSGAQRLKHDVGHGLGARRHDDNAGKRECMARWHGRLELHAVGKPKARDLRLIARQVVAVADHYGR